MIGVKLNQSVKYDVVVATSPERVVDSVIGSDLSQGEAYAVVSKRSDEFKAKGVLIIIPAGLHKAGEEVLVYSIKQN